MALSFADLPDRFKQIDNAWAWRELLRTWSTIVIAMILCGRFDYPLVWLLAFLLVGHMQYHLSVLGHHALHRNLFSNSKLNEFVSCYLLHGPLGLPNEAMRRNHMTHHRHFEEEQDYERQNYDFSLFGRDTAPGFCRWLLGIFVGGAVLPAVGRVLSGSRSQLGKAGSTREQSIAQVISDWVPVAICQLVLLAGWWLATGYWWAYGLWVLSIFTLLAGFSATRAMLEHADPAVPPQRLMTFPCSRWQRYLLGVANFNFHAEHHLYAAVPACQLEALHAYLVERDALDGVVVVPSYIDRLRQLVRLLESRAVDAR